VYTTNRKQIAQSITQELLDNDYLNLSPMFSNRQLEDIQKIILKKLSDFVIIEGSVVE